jgi:hypothetical protein
VLTLYVHVLHAVSLGNNAPFGIAGDSATAAWDPASGWGAPNLVHLPLNWLRDAIVGD